MEYILSGPFQDMTRAHACGSPSQCPLFHLIYIGRAVAADLCLKCQSLQVQQTGACTPSLHVSQFFSACSHSLQS